MSRGSTNSVWVIAEGIGGRIPGVCLELIGKARTLGDTLGGEVGVLLLGYGIQEQVDELFHAGADVVYLGDSPVYEKYQPEIFTETIVPLSKEVQPQIILLGSTFMGREQAPLIAARLGTGLTAHCIDLIINEEGILEQKIPAYGGMMTIVCPEKRPQMATVTQGVFPMPDLDMSRSGKIIPVEPPEGLRTRVETLKVVRKKPEGVPLESAPVVIAGGAGAGCAEGWQEIEDLAKTLNAAVGSTRPAVDEGWTELETMIGQSGKMVHPEFYIAVGISGDMQHMVGISGAKAMVAVNNDPQAPVFEQVDYGIVADCREFIPILLRKLREKGDL
ncbi:MAG: electron transfer flavoprotein subunit alpha/FixB family protein [Anaerolineales bacterium]